MAPATSTGVPDGAGGSYVVIEESRLGTGIEAVSEVRLLRIDGTGAPVAGWPAGGLAVALAPTDQWFPIVLSDGAGGAIVVWDDLRNGYPSPCAQRFNASGSRLWGAGGVALATGSSFRHVTSAISDGAGGVIALWDDSGILLSTVMTLHAQRVTAAGSIAAGWPAAGLTVCDVASEKSPVGMVPDGANGALAFWDDDRNGPFETYGQRLGSAGAKLWSDPDGQLLTSSSTTPVVVSDAAGGAILVWHTVPSPGEDILAQRIDGTGAPLWGPGGVVVCNDTEVQEYPSAVADGAGGAVIAWRDFRVPGYRLFAQRLTSAGAVASGWPVNGLQVSESDPIRPAVLEADGAGGAFLVWLGTTAFVDFQLRGQHVQGNGTLPSGWTTAGVPLSISSNWSDPVIASLDGAGGLIVAWLDYRAGNHSRDLYGQHVGSTGTVLWNSGGLELLSERRCQRSPAIAAGNGGSVLVGWQDKRTNSWDIYARSMLATGLPVAASRLVSSASDDQVAPRMVADGAGGAHLIWEDARGGNDRLFAQRLGADAAPSWTADGVDLLPSASYVDVPALIGDGSQGLITGAGYTFGPANVSLQRLNSSGAVLWGTDGVAPAPPSGYWGEGQWLAPTSGGGAIASFELAVTDTAFVYLGSELRVQRVNSAGLLQWGAEGTSVSSTVSPRFFGRIASDGADGVFAVWSETSDYFSPNGTLRVQRVASTGSVAPGWPSDGVVVRSDLGSRALPVQIVSDGAGGVVVGWVELRGGTGWKSYVQRVNASGVVQWTADGVALGTGGGHQFLNGLLADGSGGVFAVWTDGSGTDWDIAAQRVSAGGVPQWGAAGLAICGADDTQQGAVMAPDGSGGIVVAWQDTRSRPLDEIYVARVSGAGSLLWTTDGVVPALASLVSATLADGVARLEWHTAPFAEVAIERSEDGIAWSRRAAFPADAAGRVSFEDTDVLPARRYGWRLSLATETGEVRGEEVWLELPAGPALALGVPQPNPSATFLTVSFTVPARAPGRIEIFDVAGRRIREHDIGGFDAGSHRVRLEGPDLPAGVFVLRLTHGGCSITTRMVRTP